VIHLQQFGTEIVVGPFAPTGHAHGWTDVTSGEGQEVRLVTHDAPAASSESTQQRELLLEHAVQ